MSEVEQRGQVSLVLNALLEKINAALEEDLQWAGLPHDPDGKITEEEALLHRNGDSLMDWVVIELFSGCGGDPDDEIKRHAISCLRMGIDDLTICLRAAEGFEPGR